MITFPLIKGVGNSLHTLYLSVRSSMTKWEPELQICKPGFKSPLLHWLYPSTMRISSSYVWVCYCCITNLMGPMGQAFRQGPVVMTSLCCDVWGFSWKMQRLDWTWRTHFQGVLVTWLALLHMSITIGLLEWPLGRAPASPRTSDLRGCFEVMMFFVI